MTVGASRKDWDGGGASGPLERTVVLRNRHGLHMRPATKLYQLANRFESEIRVSKDGRGVNGKSIMELLTLAAEPGSELVLSAEGADAEEALDAIQGLIDDRFGEEA
jgi:phosphotransferase system enzyme I (PtsI)